VTIVLSEDRTLSVAEGYISRKLSNCHFEWSRFSGIVSRRRDRTQA